MTLSFPLGVGLGGTFTELEGTADGGGGGHGLIGVTGSNASRCVSFSITMVPRLGTHISCDNDSNITLCSAGHPSFSSSVRGRPCSGVVGIGEHWDQPYAQGTGQS